ncbi:MAG: hypothetical protein HRU19_22405 [Pseudobacteriovorax sp.]|nr:hypothetical protein [Pseudobacteriovorax sp.]
MRRYWGFFVISFRQSLANRWSLLGRSIFYVLILFIFSRLWQFIDHKVGIGLSATDLLWYLAMTEWIVLSSPFASGEIQEDVRSGNLAYALSRPMSYFWSKYAALFGANITRMGVLFFVGVGAAWLFGGGWPRDPSSLIWFIPFAVLASAIVLLFNCCIGVCSFWLQDSFPLYLVWQKLLFVLGGMMLPLKIYPEWLQQLASLTPFPIMLYEPAFTILTNDHSALPLVLVKLMIWLVIAGLIGQYLFKRACQSLNINGG